MARYIDVDKLLVRIKGRHTVRYFTPTKEDLQLIDIFEIINTQPTADVVEVVRCEKCKHWHNKVFDPIIEKHIGECHCPQWENDYFWYETTETDFCSNGKKEQE
jgi:hypothetical protein